MSSAPVAPPRGPGVTPPFPAPPVEGRSARVWWGIGAAALVLFLFCGGGAAALVGLGSVANRALAEQVHVVVGGYFDAVREKHYDAAYKLLCERYQAQENEVEFTRRVSAEPTVRSYDIGQLTVVSAEPAVPVDVVYDNGDTAELRVYLSQDQQTAAFEVCGIEG